MYLRFCVVSALALSACMPDEPGAVSFGNSSGSVSGLGDCHCQYDDDSQGDIPTIQIDCVDGHVGTTSVFIPAGTVDVEQGVLLLFLPSDVPAEYKAGGMGHYAKLGQEKRANASTIVREISGISYHWDEQQACNATQGCQDMYHLAAGAADGGSGACEDFWASVDQN